MILNEPRYKILKTLSSGNNSNGDIYLISIENKKYVLKTFNAEHELGLDTEIKIGSIIDHEFLSKIEGYWYDPRENTMKVIYEYTPNFGDLSEYISKSTITFVQKVEIAFSLANALMYLHSREIFHRDIKTKNIIISSSKDPVLIDYDLSCVYKENYTRMPRIRGDVTCKDDEIGGTVTYMHSYYIRSGIVGTYIDIYSLGIVYLCLFCGFNEPPYLSPRQDENVFDYFYYQKVGDRDFFIDIKNQCIIQNNRKIIPPDTKIFKYPHLCKLINRMIQFPNDISAKGLENALGLFVEGIYTS